MRGEFTDPELEIGAETLSNISSTLFDLINKSNRGEEIKVKELEPEDAARSTKSKYLNEAQNNTLSLVRKEKGTERVKFGGETFRKSYWKPSSFGKSIHATYNGELPQPNPFREYIWSDYVLAHTFNALEPGQLTDQELYDHFFEKNSEMFKEDIEPEDAREVEEAVEQIKEYEDDLPESYGRSIRIQLESMRDPTGFTRFQYELEGLAERHGLIDYENGIISNNDTTRESRENLYKSAEVVARHL